MIKMIRFCSTHTCTFYKLGSYLPDVISNQELNLAAFVFGHAQPHDEELH